MNLLLLRAYHTRHPPQYTCHMCTCHTFHTVILQHTSHTYHIYVPVTLSHPSHCHTVTPVAHLDCFKVDERVHSLSPCFIVGHVHLNTKLGPEQTRKHNNRVSDLCYPHIARQPLCPSFGTKWWAGYEIGSLQMLYHQINLQ